MIASLLGYAAIAASFVIIAVIVPDEQVRQPMWIFIFLGVAVSAHFCWSHPKAPNTPAGWFMYILIAVAGGIFLAAFDIVIHGTNSGHVIFDFALSIVGIIIASSGALRSFALGRQNDV